MTAHSDAKARRVKAEAHVRHVRGELRRISGGNWGPIQADGTRRLARQRALAAEHARLTELLPKVEAALAAAVAEEKATA